MNKLHPDLEKIVFRLKESGLSTKRFLEVNQNKQAVNSWQLDPLDVEELNNFSRLGIGGRENLVIVDCDKIELKNLVTKYLPETFATTSPRRKLPHYFFHVTGEQIKNINIYLKGVIEAVGEIRANNWYVVCPPTEITYEDLVTGKVVKGNYSIVNDAPIVKISAVKFMEVFNSFLDKKKTYADIDEIRKGVSEGDRNTSALKLATSLMRKDGLDYNGVVVAMDIWNKKNNPPLPDGEIKRIIDNAARYVSEDKKDELTQTIKYPELVVGDKPEIELPKLGRNITSFNKSIIEVINNKNILFLRTESRDIVEVGKIEHKNDGHTEYTGFITVKPPRLINILEKYIVLGKTLKNSNENIIKGQPEYIFKEKSLGINDANIMLNAPIIEEALPQITRIFNVPTPIIYKDEITFPIQGFDPRFSSWLPFDAPTISNPEMTLESAKKNIEKIFNEFCFKDDKKDFTNALAGLLTPLIRGLLPSFNTRTPVFFYIGNRERTGKDYLAGITGIVYEGYAMEEPPIITSSANKNNSNEELRKKILSALMNGRKRLHFSNNKGHLDNAVLEQIATAEKFSDRVLGRNEILTFGNPLDLSLSGNAGITYSPDLSNRCIFINLFLDIEDANQREFQNPDLHQTILKGRDMILSSLYALIRNWFNKGSPEGSKPFTSFYHWARVCGGIMEAAGYDSPCVSNDINLDVGGDSNTRDMKTLFEVIYENHSNHSVTRSTIRNTAKHEGLFGYLDLDTSSGKISFGTIITKFDGRILSDITFSCVDKSKRSNEREYIFVKKGDKLGLDNFDDKKDSEVDEQYKSYFQRQKEMEEKDQSKK